MKKAFLLLTGVVLMLVFLIRMEVLAGNYYSYKGFSALIPNGWTAMNELLFNRDVPEGVYPDKVFVETLEKPEGVSIKEYIKLYMLRIAMLYGGANFDNLEDANIDGLKAKKFYYSTKKDRELMHIDYVFFKNEYVYVIACESIPKRFVQAKTSFEEIARSFKFDKYTPEKDPKKLQDLIKLGDISMDNNRFNEAIDAYTKVLEIDPTNASVLSDRAFCFRHLGKIDEAVEDLGKAVEADPDHAVAHFNLAVILDHDLGNNQEAVEHFERYLQLSPNAPNAEQIKNEISRLKSQRVK